MEEQILKQLAQPLLAWYDIHRRILPWREEVSPYRTWVSEIMLQQTRVAAVLPYFQRFMEAFPTVGTLAQADWAITAGPEICKRRPASSRSSTAAASRRHTGS